jgi:hypothetical protein
VAADLGYTTLAMLRTSLDLKAGETSQDGLLQQAIDAASRGLDDMPPGRAAGAFLPAAAASTRIVATRRRLLREGRTVLLLLGTMCEIAAEDGLAIEVRAGTGWIPFTGWEIEHPDPGDPITVLRASHWPRCDLRITARWGWPALPPKIAQAALIQATRLYKRRTSPEGVAGSAEWGGVIRLTRLDPDVAALAESVTTPGFG